MMKKNILITGGSRGLGAELVKRLSSTPDNYVYFTYAKSPEKARELESSRENVSAVECDSKDESQVQSCIDLITAQKGTIDVLVNNACPQFRPCELLQSDWSMFQDLLDINVKGSFLFTRETAKIMKKQGHGRIINVLTSYVLNVPPEKIPFYITAKYALLGFSKASAAELSKYGILVNMVSPGLMATDLSGYLPRKYLEVYSEKHPMKRMATTEDAADVVEFLISENASFLNGVNIPVNGGESF